FQYFSTTGGIPRILLNDSRTSGSTFGKAAFADAYGPRANFSTSFMKRDKSVGIGEIVTLLWDNASAASFGRRPIESPAREYSRMEDCKTIPLRSTPSSCSNQVRTQVRGVP